MINSGQYRHFIEIWKLAPGTKKNKYGEAESTDTFIKKVPADIQSKSGSMLYGRPGDTKLSKTTHKIEYRYSNFPELDETYFIMYRGKRFDIEFVDNRNYKDEIMDVFVSARGIEAAYDTGI